MEKIIKDLNEFAKHGYNVLLSGDSGVGKTEIIKSVFNKNFGTKWKYFNGPTMNPYIDFVGVPDKEVDPETGVTYLNMVMPKDFATDNVEAIFIDELNRAKDKTRNALLELILTKSINGKKFNNLKVIWAAINEGEEYDVERLDKALSDRFQAKIIIPFKPSLDYFTKKYNNRGKMAISWWNNLPKEKQKLISPRKLDYIIEMFNKNLNINYSFPAEFRGHEIKSLKRDLNSEDNISLALKVFERKEKNNAIDLLNNPVFFNLIFGSNDNFILSTPKTVKLDDWLSYWVPMFSDEQIIMSVRNVADINKYILNEENISNFKIPLINYYLINEGNDSISRQIEIIANKIPFIKNEINEKLNQAGKGKRI